MKTLFLIRHAKSSWDQENLNDIDRPLNERGRANAPLMAKRATSWGTPGLILCSPAKRARETVKHMQPHWFPKKDVKIEPALYEGTASEVLDLIASTDDDFESIALFFHNPTITHLNQLLSGSMTVHFPTCAISCLKFDGNYWNELEVASCSLINFDFPKKNQD